MKKFWYKFTLVIMLSINLQGCLLLGGAAIGAAGVTAAYHRQKIAKILTDQNITQQIIHRLSSNTDLVRQSHIVVAAFNKVVLLAGEAPSSTLRNQAVTLAKTVPGIKHIYNEISIQAPVSMLTHTSDTWITAKVKTALLAEKKLHSGEFKVVTENGVVFLMGIVSHDQAQLAIDVTRQVSGVQKVVTVFDYLRNID